MIKLQNYSLLLHVLCAIFFVFALNTSAQWRPTPGDTIVSPKLLSGNQVQFRIYAPNAEAVKLGGGDIPNMGQGGKEMNKSPEGIWEITLPVDPGAYRYNFNVDGVTTIDPKNPATSESNMNTWSLVYVPGAEFMETQKVPHGAVATVTYYSTSLQRFRRMHVYTPPGYEAGKQKYPIFYLLHGAWDCDDSWSSVGRAGFILDNLIAAKKALPMVVIMPAGHTGPFTFGMRSDPAKAMVDEFVLDFTTDIMPYAESHYRVYTDQKHRAIAGLSMGGFQTLNIAIPSVAKFAYAGVYSSGVIGIKGNMGNPNAPAGPTWEDKNLAALDNPKGKQGLKLLWFATGTDDFLIETSRATVDMLRKHGFAVVYKETTGAHTWINWRLYLEEFAPLLFK
jgi:enterochelin esterase-like enzyme